MTDANLTPTRANNGGQCWTERSPNPLILDNSEHWWTAWHQASNLRVGGSNPSRRASYQRRTSAEDAGPEPGRDRRAAQRHEQSLPACH